MAAKLKGRGKDKLLKIYPNLSKRKEILREVFFKEKFLTQLNESV